MYPLKFKPIFQPKIWGGNALASYKNIHADQCKIGESWEISAIKGNESIVANGADAGKTLADMCALYGDQLLGRKVSSSYGNTFPLLIKFIDAADNLSIQVHPNDALAQERHQSLGKTEMWYVIRTQPEAGLYSGFKKAITPDEYIRTVDNDTFTDSLQWHEAHPGDIFFIPAGRVHAIGKGCLLAEIQQSSDVTYRIYDYGRVDDKGQQRELHKDLAKDAIDYKVYDDYKTNYSLCKNTNQQVVSCPYFTTSVLEIDESIQCPIASLGSFSIFICVEGQVSMVDNENQQISLCQGESCLIPADRKWVTIVPDSLSKLIQTHV